MKRPARRSGAEDQREAVEQPGRAEPDVAVVAGVERRLRSDRRPGLAHEAVGAVGADQQVAVRRQRPPASAIAVRKRSVDPERRGTAAAGVAGTSMRAMPEKRLPRIRDLLAPVDDVDVVPRRCSASDRRDRRLRVVGSRYVEGLVGEDDAPAERVVRPHRARAIVICVAGSRFFIRSAKQSPAGPPPTTGDLHRGPPLSR